MSNHVKSIGTIKLTRSYQKVTFEFRTVFSTQVTLYLSWFEQKCCYLKPETIFFPESCPVNKIEFLKRGWNKAWRFLLVLLERLITDSVLFWPKVSRFKQTGQTLFFRILVHTSINNLVGYFRINIFETILQKEKVRK